MQRNVTIRRRDLRDWSAETDALALSPAERLSMMWQLALDAYAFVPNFDAQSRLPRHFVRVLRRER